MKSKAMMCIDREELTGGSLKLYGENDLYKSRRLELIYLPCKPIQLTDKNKRFKDQKCIYNVKSKKAR